MSRVKPWLVFYHGRDAVRGFLTHMHRNLEVTGEPRGSPPKSAAAYPSDLVPVCR
jgi:hypothetical protein